MPRVFARSALSLVSFVAVAVAVPTSSVATTSHRSTEDVVALPAQVQHPSVPLCPRNYQDTSYSSRSHCAGVGEARQLFITGQVIPAEVGQPVGYAQLNAALRAEYRLDAEPDYVFANGYLYAIDHGTKVVRRVVPVELAR